MQLSKKDNTSLQNAAEGKHKAAENGNTQAKYKCPQTFTKYST